MTGLNNGRRFTDGNPIDGTAHYTLNADEFDARLHLREAGITPFDASDPVSIAQCKAGEAAIELNSKLAGQRTPEEVARVERLSEIARSMASDANLAAMVVRSSGTKEI